MIDPVAISTRDVARLLDAAAPAANIRTPDPDEACALTAGIGPVGRKAGTGP